MLPFRFQIVSVAHHSLGAIEGVQRGQFAPPGETPPHDYAALQKLVADARDGLLRLTPGEVNALEEGDVVFQIRDFKMPFTAEGFFDVLLAAQLLQSITIIIINVANAMNLCFRRSLTKRRRFGHSSVIGRAYAAVTS